MRQCERSWLKLCKWQRVHSEWQLFLRRLRWLIKGFHLPLTEINHSTHTHFLWWENPAQRSGVDGNEMTGAARPCRERDHPWLSVCWSLSRCHKALLIARVTLFLWGTGGHRLRFGSEHLWMVLNVAVMRQPQVWLWDKRSFNPAGNTYQSWETYLKG